MIKRLLHNPLAKYSNPERSAALQQHEELFRLSFETAAIGLVHVALDGTWLRVNQKFCRILGYTADQACGMNFQEVTHVDDLDANLALVQRLLAGEIEQFTTRKRYWHKEERVIWAKLTVALIRTENKEPLCFIAAIEDISNVIEMEQAEAILDHGPNAKLLLDEQMMIQRVNRVFHQMFGSSEESLQGMALFALIAQEDLELVQQVVIQATATNLLQCVDVRMVQFTANSTKQQFTPLAQQNSLSPFQQTVSTSDTQPTHDLPPSASGITDLCFDAQLSISKVNRGGYVCTVVDISERKAQERMLRYHAGLQANVSDAVIAKDLEMRIQSWNRAAEQIYGWRADEVLGKYIQDVVVTEESAEERDHHLQLLAEQGWWHGEVVQKRKDGVKLRILRSVTVLKDNYDKPYGIVTVNHDVTARHEALGREKELVKLRERVAVIEREHELTELKERFVYMASHELRTPIATILALTETLLAYRDRMTNQQINDRLEKTRVQLHFLEKMTEELLLLASFDANKKELQRDAVDLDHLCRELIDEITSAPDVTHTIRYQLSSPAENHHNLLLDGDRTLLRQIISNLLTNAIKFSPSHQPIDLTASFTSNHIFLTIEDRGIGIPQADIAHLFEPFHRARNAESIRGTGLGLAIVKAAVELHGGTIGVKSDVHIGTTFTITLQRFHYPLK